MVFASGPSLSHETLLSFLGQVTLLLVSARLLGEWMRKLGQPAVAGELLAGLLVGPSVFGLFFPQAYRAVFPPDPLLSSLLSAFSLIGVLMLLIVTGLEIDMALIGRRLRTATYASLGGLVVPFVLGLGLGWVIPEVYLASPSQRPLFALFVAVCLSISAIPVIAKVLMDLKAMRRDIAQVTLAAAMIDDAVGWCLLSVAAGLAVKGKVTAYDASYSLLMSVLVMGLALWRGRYWVNRLVVGVDRRFPGESSQLSLVLFLALAFACLTHGLGLEAMLGAFLAGILVGQSPRLKRPVTHTLELFTTSFFAPLFFATAGLKVNLVGLFTPELILLTLLVCLVATVGKYLGCYVGGWLGGLGHWERLCLGSGMNPRGAMGVIVASIGLNLGILSEDTYSLLVAMAILTSLAAPPLLRWSLARVEVSEEEKARLKKELLQAESFLNSLGRVLLPVRGGPNAEWAAHLLGHLSHHHPVEITALFASNRSEQVAPEVVEGIQQQLERSQGPAPKIKQIAIPGAISQAIVKEAERGGYDLIVLGATGTQQGQVFTRLLDDVLGVAPCAAMVVRAHPRYAEMAGQIQIQRILLPVVGTQASLKAAEVASVICRSMGARLTVLHVIPSVEDSHFGPRGHEMSIAFAAQLVDNHAEIARGLGLEVDTLIRESTSPVTTILQEAESGGFDLIFMGLNFRPVSGSVFLGHRAERVMQAAPCAAVALGTGFVQGA